MLIFLLKAILRDWHLKDLTLHNTEIGKIIEIFYKACSVFENIKVFGWFFTKSQWGVWEHIGYL